MAPQTLSTTRDVCNPIDARGGGNVNVNRFTLPKDPVGILTAVVLALSIAVNIWCGWVIRDVGTIKWLHDYDLNQFQMHEFAQLKGEVDLDHELIKAFGPQQCRKTP